MQQTLSSYGHYITLSLYNNIHIHDSHWVCNMFTYFSALFVQTFNLPCSPLLSSRQFFSFLVLLHRKMKLSNHFIIFFELSITHFLILLLSLCCAVRCHEASTSFFTYMYWYFFDILDLISNLIKWTIRLSSSTLFPCLILSYDLY